MESGIDKAYGLKNQRKSQLSFCSIFKPSLFFSESHEASTKQLENVLANIQLPTLTETHLAMLNKLFTYEEIKEAITQLGSFKAPGSDGKPAIFYQRY